MKNKIIEIANEIAELHYPNQPNAIIDEPYRKVRMETLKKHVSEVASHIEGLGDKLICEHDFDDPFYHKGGELMGYYCSKCGEVKYI